MPFIQMFVVDFFLFVSLSTAIVHCFMQNRFICKYIMNSVMAHKTFHSILCFYTLEIFTMKKMFKSPLQQPYGRELTILINLSMVCNNIVVAHFSQNFTQMSRLMGPIQTFRWDTILYVEIRIAVIPKKLISWFSFQFSFFIRLKIYFIHYIRHLGTHIPIDFYVFSFFLKKRNQIDQIDIFYFAMSISWNVNYTHSSRHNHMGQILTAGYYVVCWIILNNDSICK